MIKKSDYAPLTKVAENVYKLMFNKEDMYEDIFEENESGERVATGEKKETDSCIVNVEYLYSKPTVASIKNIILNWLNNEIDNKILSGFTWKDYPVWLSSENQFNYKAAYDLAVQTEGGNLPVKVKFGSTDTPQYHTFETLEDFADFFTSAMTYINNTLAEGWEKKDTIDFSVYESALVE